MFGYNIFDIYRKRLCKRLYWATVLMMQSKYRGEPAAAHAEVLQYSDLPTADVEQLAVILLILENLSHITEIKINKKILLILNFVISLRVGE